MPLVAGHQEVDFSGQSARDEFVVIRIRRGPGRGLRIEEVSAAAKQFEQSINFFYWKTKPWAEENFRVLVKNLGGKNMG